MDYFSACGLNVYGITIRLNRFELIWINEQFGRAVREGGERIACLKNDTPQLVIAIVVNWLKFYLILNSLVLILICWFTMNNSRIFKMTFKPVIAVWVNWHIPAKSFCERYLFYFLHKFHGLSNLWKIVSKMYWKPALSKILWKIHRKGSIVKDIVKDT